MTDPTILVCSPCTQAPTPTGANRFTCHRCSADVWVSSSMTLHVMTGKVRPTCVRCASGVMNVVGKEAMIHPDQVAELRELGILDFATRTVEHVNRAARREQARRHRRGRG